MTINHKGANPMTMQRNPQHVLIRTSPRQELIDLSVYERNAFEENLIRMAIATRAIKLMHQMGHSVPEDQMLMHYEITGKLNLVHANIIPIRHNELLASNDFDFITDVIGILDNTTADCTHFLNNFMPKCGGRRVGL